MFSHSVEGKLGKDLMNKTPSVQGKEGILPKPFFTKKLRFSNSSIFSEPIPVLPGQGVGGTAGK